MITATGTRRQVKKDNKTLLPHPIITNSSSRFLTQSHSIKNFTLRINTINMADQTLLVKARFDDLPNFSGHPSEDAEHFLKSIKNITKANGESDNYETLEIIRGKLVHSAGIWFDNNEYNFKSWSDFETAFRNRYFSTTMLHDKFNRLKQRKPLPDELVTSYIDDVVNLCREVDPNMSEQIIIQHLMSGLNSYLKKEISRRESCMNTLDEFSKYAKIEQDLYDTFEKYHELSFESNKPSFPYRQSQIPSLAIVTRRTNQYYSHAKQGDPPNPLLQQSSVIQRNPIRTSKFPSTTPNKSIRNHLPSITFKRKQNDNLSSSQQKFNPCKICGRTNHRAIHCFYKRTTGCFNCGQNHIVRNCTMPPNFQ